MKFTPKPTGYRNGCPDVLLETGVLKICNKFTGEHQCRSAISIKLHGNFIEMALRHGFSPVNLLHIFRTHFLKNTSGRLLAIQISNIVYFTKINSGKLYL